MPKLASVSSMRRPDDFISSSEGPKIFSDGVFLRIEAEGSLKFKKAGFDFLGAFSSGL